MAFWSFANRPDTSNRWPPSRWLFNRSPSSIPRLRRRHAPRLRSWPPGRTLTRRRGGFGLLGFVLVLVAAVGVILLVFAVREGSFSAGGAVVDNKLVQATSGVAPALDSAASKTGTALETAGQNLKDQGAAIAGSSTPESERAGVARPSRL